LTLSDTSRAMLLNISSAIIKNADNPGSHAEFPEFEISDYIELNIYGLSRYLHAACVMRVDGNSFNDLKNELNEYKSDLMKQKRFSIDISETKKDNMEAFAILLTLLAGFSEAIVEYNHRRISQTNPPNLSSYASKIAMLAASMEEPEFQLLANAIMAYARGLEVPSINMI